MLRLSTTPINATDARVASWGGWSGSTEGKAQLGEIYKMIRVACNNFKRSVVFYHTEPSAVHSRIVQVLRTGGYDVVQGYSKRNERFEIEINW
ncbi:hypothetical protein [Pectobacterium phage Wc4-1]|uniref:Uncharacterized protein n=1 Tax=Pectobacterium phage Wc4 TaxID=2652428 RepID=A0A5P8D479_9CAUD|nr:hypothetical protein [Pectobacterium phage Wc4]QFP94032.1 hypothetical protein [Pectobacterium phage Wc4-1]